MPKHIPTKLTSADLAEDTVKLALADKYPSLVKKYVDGTMTLRWYGREFLIDIRAFDVTEPEEDKPVQKESRPRPNIIE